MTGAALLDPSLGAPHWGGGVLWRGESGALVARLPGGRLHFQHGPIDIIALASGSPEAVREGERCAILRFDTILAELCSELSELRSPEGQPTGPVAQLMARAVAPFRPAFITPMAAVAGAVAETILAQLARPGITRAYANNGGDIALHLAAGEKTTCALATRPGLPDRLTVHSTDPVRGIATSGWRGRSWSLGIADAVTVVARTAAMADAAATMIANAVDLPGHSAIQRRPAVALQADSDLGDRLVTVGVGLLGEADRNEALDRGLATAEAFRARGLVEGAALFLQGAVRTTGLLAPALWERTRDA